MQTFAALFSPSPKKQEADPAIAANLAAQDAALKKREAQTEAESAARARALAGRQGRGQGVTLFVPTGESGVASVAGAPRGASATLG